ncbi:MAG: cyclopropane fatty acyl phospholipid synthase [Terrimicrobiaceae bacterium]
MNITHATEAGRISTPEMPRVVASNRADSDERNLSRVFSDAGVEINGPNSSDIQVHDKRFYRRVMAHGTLGFGESYMEGWWDCEDIEEMCFRAIRHHLEEKLRPHVSTIVEIALAGVLNFHTKNHRLLLDANHYDLENDFFKSMLDPTMQYSCAYFQETDDLEIAQRLKMALICKKLGLKAGMRLLDIGCGWGGLAKYAAEAYGCTVTGITLSKNQKAYAEQSCRGLPVDIRLQDYREVEGPFDRIVSVGMLEHVGYKNYQKYMEAAQRCLKNDGLFLCHTIATNRSGKTCDPWITHYIFPNSMLPSAAQVLKASEGLFVLEDVQNLAPHYVLTLRKWREAFENSSNRFGSRYGDQIIRMWRFYLLSCAGAFRARSMQVFQFMFSKDGVRNEDVLSAGRPARSTIFHPRDSHDHGNGDIQSARTAEDLPDCGQAGASRLFL